MPRASELNKVMTWMNGILFRVKAIARLEAIPLEGSEKPPFRSGLLAANDKESAGSPLLHPTHGKCTCKTFKLGDWGWFSKQEQLISSDHHFRSKSEGVRDTPP